MITLDQIRAQYPGADRLSDDELIGVAAERYGTTPDIFKEAIGYQPAPVESPGIIGRAKDLGISALKGAIAVPEAAVGLADLVTGGYAGKAAEAIGFRPKEAKDILSEGYSDAQKRANEEVQKAEGIWDTLKAAVSNPSVLAQTVTESIPSMLGGGIIAGGLIKGTRLGATVGGRLAASGIGEGVVGAGSSAEQIRQQTDDGLLTSKQAAVAGASGIATGALGVLGAKVAKSLGIADVDSMLAGAAQDTVVAKGVARRILEGAVAEGLIEELPQSVQEQVAQNYALGKPLDEGVSQAAVLGTLSGAVMSAGANLLPSKPAIQPPKPTPPEDKPAAPAPTLMLGNTPDPIVVFPDGTAGRRSDLEAYINNLPEDQRVAARAKLMGMGARDVTPADILSASSADDAIAKFAASITGSDLSASLGQDNPLIAASRDMQAQAAADEADLADLAQSEARDPNTMRALAVEDARKQQELDALQATGTGQYGVQPEQRPAVEAAATVEAPSIMQLAMQRARERAAQTQVADITSASDDGVTYEANPNGDGQIMVTAKVGGKMAGRMAATIREISGKRYLSIDDVFVKDGFQGKGIGTGLYERAIDGLPEGVDGLLSEKSWVKNDKQVPAIHKKLRAKYGANEIAEGIVFFPSAPAPTPIQRQPDILPSDISREDGTPFKSESGAKYKQRFAGGIDGSDIVPVAGGFVIRPKPTQENVNGTQADQAVQAEAQRQEPAASPAPVAARIPDPIQPAEGGTVPAQAQTDPRLIPVSKRGEPAVDAALPEDPRLIPVSKRKSAGASNLRKAGYARNPLLAFLATHGLRHKAGDSKSLKTEFSPDKQIMVMGHGPVFRQNGRQLDEILPLAIQDGYLPPGSDETDLANLIASAIRGDRVAPMFTEDGAEQAAAQRDQRDREDYERKAIKERMAEVRRQIDAAAGPSLFDQPAEQDPEPTPEQQAAAPAPVVPKDIEAIQEALRLAQASATKRVMEDGTTLREFITKAIAGGDRSPQVNPKRQEVARLLGLTVERVPQPRSSALVLEIKAGESPLLDMTIAEVRAMKSTAAAPANRFEAGQALTKEQRKAVIKSLVDVYKAKGAPREQKGVGRDGNERYGYVHSPELFEKSDITGAMVRYYVTLPDGRIAHPSELFPDYTQADIDAAMAKNAADERTDADSQRRAEANAEQFSKPSAAEADADWVRRNPGPNALVDWRTNKRYSLVPMTKDGKFYSVRDDDTALMKRLERAGWVRADAAGNQAEPAAQATAILDAANVTGKDRLDIIKDVKSGALTPDEVQAAFPGVENSPEPAPKPGEVDNFGEALPPARRNMAAKLDEELSDSDIANRPLSEIWPLAENQAIEDTFAAAVAHAARAEVPSKPRVAYKLKQWVQKVKTVRELAAMIVSGRFTREQFIAKAPASLKDWMTKVMLLEQIPRDQWNRVDAVEERPDSFGYKDGQQVRMPHLNIRIDGKSHWLTGDADIDGDVRGTLIGNMQGVRALLAAAEPEERMQFEIRQRRGGKVFINKKGDSEYRALMEFDVVADARKAINEQYAELVAAWEATKARDNITERDLRSAENRPRAGKDHRGGRDVTPEEFQSKFGFRGGEFGKWVKQGKGDKERQAILNNAYDALMDLASIAGIPPRAISLNGTLGIAFGSRGSGWASAHFEPGNLVMNLTKTRGAGALAHEWFHALDNYFSRMRRDGEEDRNFSSAKQYNDQNFITHRPEPMMVPKNVLGGRYLAPMTLGKLQAMHEARKDKTDAYNPDNWQRDPKTPEGVRPEVEARFAALVDELNKSPMTKRAMLLDGVKSGEGYWSRTLERAARAFESYVIAKMHEEGYHNDFLVNVRKSDETGKAGDRYPYLMAGEVKPIAEAFDALFDTIETAEDHAGNVAIREPDAPYETDLFGQPVPTPTGRPAPAGSSRARVRGDVQPAAGVQDTPAPAGEYFASTIVGSEVSRELGASKITTPEHAAQATAYLYKSAVERLDGIVTDANGKPLGIVGGFKGASTQASVYPATLMAEAVRIPGAARIWFSHNHPSGNSSLSRADENLNSVLTDVFRGSGIEPMGLLAIGDGRFSHVGNSSGSMISNEPITAPTSRVSVPVIERTLAPNGVTGTTISSPQAAKQVARDFYDRAKQPGLMLLNSQNSVIGWVPITDQMRGELRGTGGLNAVYRAISESNAGAAIIVHGGELTHQSIPKRFPQVTPSENIAAALAKIDVRPLDSIEIRPTSTKSAAEIGMSIADGPVFARGNPFYSALTQEVGKIPAKAQSGMAWVMNITGLVKAGKVKQDEVEWSGVIDWLKLTGAEQRVNESGFGLVMEMQNDAGQWEQVDDLNTYFRTEAEARAAITAEMQAGAQQDAKNDGVAGGRIAVKAMDYLDFGKRTTPKITRDQVVQYLEANGVRVEETVLGGGNKPPGYDADIELLSDNGLTLERNPEDPSMVAFMDENGDLLSADELAEEPGLAKDLVLAAYRVQEAADADKVPTRYGGGNLVLPSGTNYREVLLTLPAKPVQAQATSEQRAYFDFVDRMQGEYGDQWRSKAPIDDRLRAAELERAARQSAPRDAANPDGIASARQDRANFRSTHWDQPNVLAHIRVNDRTSESTGYQVQNKRSGNVGQTFDTRAEADANINTYPEAMRGNLMVAEVPVQKRVLFVEEIQSDWGQAGKKQGFAKPAMEDAFNARGEPIGMVNTGRSGVPMAPFVTKTDAWLSLALKRIVKMAVDEGYDRVAFINGDQSAERYDLSKQVDSIGWAFGSGMGSSARMEGRTVTVVYARGTESTFSVDAAGKVIDGPSELFGRGLDDVVGKDIAEKIMGEERGSLRGLDLKLGGEGMKAFYDKIVPNTLKDVLRKVGGGQIETVIVETDPMAGEGPEFDTPITDDGLVPRRQPGFTITPAMQERAADGLPLFDRSTGALRAVLQSMTGQGMTVAQVQDIVQPMAAKWDVEVRVVNTPADLPIKAPSDALGLHYNGVIYIVARTNRSKAQALRTLAHEAVAHYGLRSMLGRDGWRTLMRQIQFASRFKAGPLRDVSDYIRRTYVDENGKFNLSETQEGDEIAARVVELGVDPATGEFRPGFAFLKAVFSRVAEFLRGLGFNIEFTNLELQGMLVRSQRALARRAGRPVAVSGVAAARGGARSDVNRMTSEQMQSEIRSLIPRVEQAYEDGNQPLAERLDARLETLMENLEANYLETEEDRLTAVDMLNPMSAARVADGEQGDTEADLVRDLANTWKEMSTGFGWGNQNLSDAEKATQLRGMVDDYAYRHGGIKPGVTDQQILDAAEDAFQSVYGLRAKQLERMRRRGQALTEYRPQDTTPEEQARIDKAMADQGDARQAELRAKREQAGDAGGETPVPDWMMTGQFARGGPKKSLVTGQPLPQTWQGPDESRMDDILYSMQDKHIDTKRVVKAVRDSIGTIADNLDPYLQEELYHGRAAMATKEFLEKSIRPLLTDMQTRGVEMSDFEEYLHNRHAERRNIQVAKVNPNMPDGGSGIKTADARAYLAGLTPAKRTAYQALAKRVDQMNRDTRALLVSSGLEKQSTIDAWQAAYGDEYVPLMREEMDNGTTGIGQGFSVRGSSSKRAMGSNKPVANILANIALQREKAITRAEKRRIGEALYGMVLSAPNPDFWIAVDPALQQNPAQITATAVQLISMGLNPVDAQAIASEPTQRYIDPRTGQVASRINPALRGADNALAVRIDGEDKYVFFNAQDPRAMRMAKALKNLDPDQLGVVMGNAAKMTRYFSSINTQYNPIFGVVNLVRDIQTALLNLQSTGLAGKQAEVMKHVGSALRGIYIDLRDHRAGKTPTSTWANLFEEFQREGGATGYRDMYANAQDRADAITDELKKIKEGKAMAAGRGIMGWLSDYNESMENAVRLATYKVAKERGMSNQQAASVAKNLTVNFNRKGQVALQAGALYAFFNASVQGTARMAETMFEGKKLSSIGKKIITGGLLLGSMQALLLAAAGYDDEEPPDFVRERSLVLPIGGDKYVSIPMPLGFHVIPNLARIPTEWAMGGFRDTPKRLGQLVGLFFDAFNPIGSAGVSLQTITPTIIDPLAALAENKDWTGKPIAKKDFNSMQPTAGHTRAKDTATPWARAIAYGINIATGGTEYKPGIASPTPDQIDYLIGQATGGVGREASKLSQVGSATVSGEELPLYKIPLIGRFVGATAGQAAESGRFYENLKQIGEHDAELTGLKKDRRMSEYQQYMRENPEARMVPMAERTYREVSKLMRMKRDAIRDGASQERVRMLDQQITARMRAFNQRVRATEPAT